MDDEPTYAADHVVTLTLGSAITIPETTNGFAIKRNHLTLVKGNQFDGTIKTVPHKHIHEFLRICDIFKYRDTKNEAVCLMMFPLSHTGEAKTWLDKLNEGTIETIMARMDAMAMKIDAQYKEFQSRSKQPNPDHNNDDKHISPEEEAKFMQTFRHTRRPFLHTADAVIRVKQKQRNLGVDTERITFSIDSTMKHSYLNEDTCFSIDVINEILEEDFDALLDEESKILHFIKGTILKEKLFVGFDEFMANRQENSKSESDTEEPPIEKITFNTYYKIKTSLEEPPSDLELKPFPYNLEYVFLEELSFLPIIISSKLSKHNKNKVVSVLKRHKQASAWKTTDIPGICLSFCKHKIQLLEDKKPWVSPIHCVPKKGGITVVTNEKDKLVPTRTVTGWRVCIDYPKLNEATAKDHFPLPFMNQMLERLAGNKYFYFLDGFSRYFHIPIDPMDQEKTAFTCPFGTYAYMRMPFGLCNALTTFQRCMLAIFHDMIEEPVEVFMDDFSVFENSFNNCLKNLDKMLQCCKDANLVLNWEKCHFMVKEGIVLRYKVSGAGLEVDKSKVDIISKLRPPSNVKGIRSFLGHASLYRSFIKDFSKIIRPLTKLLEKYTPFEFNDEGHKTFNSLKEKLTCTLVIVSLNWNLPFELMCDASDFTVGAVLEFDIKIKDKNGTENVAADHLSRIENDETSDDSDVDDNFPGETLMKITMNNTPWFADFANYLVGDIIPKEFWFSARGNLLVTVSKFMSNATINVTSRVVLTLIKVMVIERIVFARN
ncbi:reverse transcriptase domain-containing protein [Tanacetum coccineum]